MTIVFTETLPYCTQPCGVCGRDGKYPTIISVCGVITHLSGDVANTVKYLQKCTGVGVHFLFVAIVSLP